MKLFLDDIRVVPKGFDIAVTDYHDRILMLDLFDFEFVSLDYSLWQGEPTGYDVLVWMVEHNKFPERLNIHSNNVYGCDIMRTYIKESFPKDYNVTYNTLSK